MLLATTISDQFTNSTLLMQSGGGVGVGGGVGGGGGALTRNISSNTVKNYLKKIKNVRFRRQYQNH